MVRIYIYNTGHYYYAAVFTINGVYKTFAISYDYGEHLRRMYPSTLGFKRDVAEGPYMATTA